MPCGCNRVTYAERYQIHALKKRGDYIRRVYRKTGRSALDGKPGIAVQSRGSRIPPQAGSTPCSFVGSSQGGQTCFQFMLTGMPNCAAVFC